MEKIWEARHISREAEEKASHVNRRVDDAQLSKLKAKKEVRSLKVEVKRLESELSKSQPDAEARLSAEKKV